MRQYTVRSAWARRLASLSLLALMAVMALPSAWAQHDHGAAGARKRPYARGDAGALFAGMAFKRSECRTVPFRRMKVHVKAEIVPLGIEGVDATKGGGIDVSPAAWRELIARGIFEMPESLGRSHIDNGR